MVGAPVVGAKKPWACTKDWPYQFSIWWGCAGARARALQLRDRWTWPATRRPWDTYASGWRNTIRSKGWHVRQRRCWSGTWPEQPRAFAWVAAESCCQTTRRWLLPSSSERSRQCIQDVLTWG